MGFDLAKLIEDAKLPLAKIDIPTVIGLLIQIKDALPAIEGGIAKAAPYVEAIGTTLAGNTPTDEQWDALNERLDAGSSELQAAAAEDLDPANLDPAIIVPDPAAGAGEGEPKTITDAGAAGTQQEE